MPRPTTTRTETPAHALHVAIVEPRYLDLILSGDKTAELRLTRVRCAPFGRVHAGDVVYFKDRSGGYRARARVRGVRTLEDLRRRDFIALRREHGRSILADPDFWKQREHARHATLILLERVESVDRGPSLAHVKRGTRAAWHVCPPHLDPGPAARDPALF